MFNKFIPIYNTYITKNELRCAEEIKACDCRPGFFRTNASVEPWISDRMRLFVLCEMMSVSVVLSLFFLGVCVCWEV